MESRTIEEKAKKNELNLNDAEGATFTIANLGQYNVSSFVPIVNSPQACILGIGVAEKSVVFNEKAPKGENAYK